MKTKTKTEAPAKKPSNPRNLRNIPLAVPPPLYDEIQHAAGTMCRHQADIMRLAMSIGLRALRNANYDEAGSILGSPRADLIKPTPSPLRNPRTK